MSMDKYTLLMRLKENYGDELKGASEYQLLHSITNKKIFKIMARDEKRHAAILEKMITALRKQYQH